MRDRVSRSEERKKIGRQKSRHFDAESESAIEKNRVVSNLHKIHLPLKGGKTSCSWVTGALHNAIQRKNTKESGW